MEYKGYTGIVEFDDDAGVFTGEVVGIRDVVTFRGTTVGELRESFKKSIDFYLALCEEQGEPPDHPFSGKFMVRVNPELHRAIATRAKKAGKSLNAWITESLTKTANE